MCDTHPRAEAKASPACLVPPFQPMWLSLPVWLHQLPCERDRARQSLWFWLMNPSYCTFWSTIPTSLLTSKTELSGCYCLYFPSASKYNNKNIYNVSLQKNKLVKGCGKPSDSISSLIMYKSIFITAKTGLVLCFYISSTEIWLFI